MTKINKYIKGQFDEVVFERDGQEHTVLLLKDLYIQRQKNYSLERLQENIMQK